MVLHIGGPAPTKSFTHLLGVLRQALHDDVGFGLNVVRPSLLVWVPAVQVWLALEVVLTRLVSCEHGLAS